MMRGSGPSSLPVSAEREATELPGDDANPNVARRERAKRRKRKRRQRAKPDRLLDTVRRRV
jgi:hypothetical protein